MRQRLPCHSWFVMIQADYAKNWHCIELKPYVLILLGAGACTTENNSLALQHSVDSLNGASRSTI